MPSTKATNFCGLLTEQYNHSLTGTHRLHRVTGKQTGIALVTTDIEMPIGDRILDCAFDFVRVRTIRVPTLIHVRTQVAEKSGDFFGNHIP